MPGKNDELDTDKGCAGGNNDDVGHSTEATMQVLRRGQRRRSDRTDWASKRVKDDDDLDEEGVAPPPLLSISRKFVFTKARAL